MPWYLFQLTGGKGSPHHKEEYKWYETSLSRTSRDELWEDWATEFHFERCYNGKVTQVTKLPEEVRDRMIANEREKIERAEAAITQLLLTPIRKKL